MEDRVWRHGVELVSHVNFTQLARVRNRRDPLGTATAPRRLP